MLSFHRVSCVFIRSKDVYLFAFAEKRTKASAPRKGCRYPVVAGGVGTGKRAVPRGRPGWRLIAVCAQSHPYRAPIVSVPVVYIVLPHALRDGAGVSTRGAERQNAGGCSSDVAVRRCADRDRGRLWARKLIHPRAILLVMIHELALSRRQQRGAAPLIFFPLLSGRLFELYITRRPCRRWGIYRPRF